VLGFLETSEASLVQSVQETGSLNLIERTNKMQQCSRIYYSNVS
jgi:hypothetical protein